MSTHLPRLFSPALIGGLALKNRIFSSGHDTTLPTDGRVNEALIAYHEARAQGGVGLIVSQVVGVHDSARYTSHILMGDGDDCIPGFRQLARSVQAHGTRIVCQLFHPGREIMESQDGSAPVAWAPSATPSERFHVIPRAMPLAFVEEIIACYGHTARRLREAGVDGVEIVASHGYLPAQFLNPQVNLRDDDYGGSAENRLRFLHRIIAAVRREAGVEVGDEFVVGLRISGDERDDLGLSEAQALAAIDSLAAQLDYVSVIAGTSASAGGAVHIVPPMSIEHGYLAPLGAAVKQRVRIPVLLTGRINQPQLAERIIASGQADLCGMTRAMICDPQMPAKAEAGRLDDIRACIGCNQACIGHFHKGYPISCIQHPETGRELLYGELTPARSARDVLVVGGGPAGMKAAVTAAKRGHRVTLHEAAARLGGQALLAQLLPERAEFGGIVSNLARELQLAGVEVVCNSRIDRAQIERLRPDALIVASGGKPYWPQQLEIDSANQLVDAWQVLRGEVQTGNSVLVADWRCDWVGAGVAELLARAGCRVRLAVNGLHAGELMPNYVRDSVAGRLHGLGVEVIPYARLFGADGDAVYLQHSASGAAMVIEGVDTLVLAQGQAAESELLDALADYPAEVIGIGDCLAPRSAEEAVLEGLKVGAAI